MDNTDEVLKLVFIGFLVAGFLFNSTRILQAIELYRECLILFQNKALKNESVFVAAIKEQVYLRIFYGYQLINDYTSAIEWGRELLFLAQESGKREVELEITFRLAKLCHSKGIYQDAEELYSKALSIMISTGERKGQCGCYGNLATLHWSMGKYSKAKDYLEKALGIAKEIGERNKEAWCFLQLGSLAQSFGEYAIAKEYQEKSLAITKEIGDKKNESSCYAKLGTVLQFLGEYSKAEEYLKNAMTIAQEISDKKNEASCYEILGTLFLSIGEYAKAKVHLKRAIAIAVEIGDKKNEALYYGKLGHVFRSTFEYTKAMKCHEKALSIIKELGDKQNEHAYHNDLGMIFKVMGEYVKAKEYFDKALAITKEFGDRKNEAACHLNLGTFFRSVGEYAKAKTCVEKALEITREIGHRENEFWCCAELGTMVQSIGEFVRSKEYHQEALAIAKEIGDRNKEAMQYGELGKVFESLGNYVKARDYHEKALAIIEEIGDRRSAAAGYYTLGTMFYFLGKFAKSKECLEKALTIARAIGENKFQALCCGSLGALLESLGEYSEAGKYLDESLTVTEKIGDKAIKGTCYQNLGTLFHSMGNYEKAAEYHENALAITKEMGYRKEEASCYRCLGVVCYTLGDHAKAKEYFEKALAITETVLDKRGEAESYGNLGLVFQSLGECARAKECHKKALEISTNTGDIKTEIATQQNIAFLMLLEGEVHEAKSYLLASLNSFQKMGIFLTDNDHLKISLLDKHVIVYQVLSCLFCYTKNPNQALCVVELGRARALADLMSSQYSVQKQISENPETWIGFDNIMTNERNCTCLYISYWRENIYFWILKADTPTRFRLIDVNNCFAETAERNVDEILGTEIFRQVRALPPGQCEDRSWFPSSANHPMRKSARDGSLAEFRPVEEDENVNQSVDSTLDEFYNMFIAPVAALIDESEILIVPERSLFKVSFAALKDERGKYLSESFRIRIVPSLTTLKLIQDSPVDYHRQTDALIVGDPEVGEVLYKGNLQQKSRLPFAGEEAQMIGKLLGTQPLLGKDATKQVVLQSIDSVSLIHFAAHGNAERGEIILAPPPLMNRVPQEEDYLLTMADISKVQVRAKLVVLSCCHSANGHIRAEGAVGMARAFLGSGARSVLVALWAIEDKATKQFMNRFYEHLVRGESASESLHQAMKWMRENGFSDFRQWAPFMLIGDNVSFEFGN